MTDEKLDDLSYLARQAAPGPWVATIYADIKEAKKEGGFKWCGRDVEWQPGDVWQKSGADGATGLPGSIETTAENARFIAAADPTTVLALVREIRRLRKLVPGKRRARGKSR